MTTEINSRTKRSQVEITASVLEEAVVPLLKNHIIYKCNINDDLFKKYVLPLVDNGNLEVMKENDDAPEFYRRTGPGTILLQQLRDVISKLGKSEGAVQ